MRRLRLTCLLLLVAVTSNGVRAARGPSVAEVVAVQAAGVADVVLLNHGFDAGLRQGMVCRLSRGAADVAEILLVDLRPTCSAALIVNVASRQSIRAGDQVSLKVFKS